MNSHGVQCEYGTLETAEYRSGVKVSIPYYRLTGDKPGPVVTVLAGQHGRELNGIEAIRRVLTQLQTMPLRGTCIFVPCANPVAVRMRQQDFPYETGRYISNAPGFNLNRVWPGKADGSLYELMAHVLWQELISGSNLCIDLHGWTGRSASLTWGYQRDAEYVRAFGCDIHLILDDCEADLPTGQLEKPCYHANIVTLTAELTPQNLLSEHSIAIGVRGQLNTLKMLDMIDGDVELPEQQIELDSRSVDTVVTTPVPGLLVPRFTPPALVTQGETIAEVVDLHDVLHAETFTAPIDGVVFNTGLMWCEDICESNMVDAGETIALVKPVARVLSHVEK